MVFRNRLLAVVAGFVLLAVPRFGFAETTTIEVPQGTGVFPTIGQIKCLEELGSGRFCAATYECSDNSGELWGDLANHNGRRAIGAASPVANQRDCVITVDGKASARWLTGYRPAGREGELVGLTTSADALRPVVRTTGTTGTGDGGRSLLHYILERHDTSVAEIAELKCDDYRRETAAYTECFKDRLRRTLSYVSTQDDNELTRCLVDHHENWCRQDPSRPWGGFFGCDDGAAMAIFLDGSLTGDVRYDPFQALRYGYGSNVAYRYEDFNEASGFPCRDLAEEHLARLSIGVRYCGDECPNPNEYELTVME